jgi:(p)ppGpp synthase/HD superfamily hydrolase
MFDSIVAMEITAALSVEPVRNPDLAVQCALLHDTIEDTDVTYDQVKDQFGTNVADGVMALSQDITVAASESKLKRKSLQLEDSVRRIKLQPMEVWMVKLADRITNLQPPPSHWNDDKIENYRKGAEVIYKELEVASAYLGDRLRVKIDRYGDV